MAKRPVAPQKATNARANSKPAPAKANASESTPGWFMGGLLILLLTAACYYPSLKNQLVNWDDDPNITENPNIVQLGVGTSFGETTKNIFSLDKGAVIGNYNPLPIFTFAIEKQIFGKVDPKVIHTNNLILHLITTFLVMLLLARMGIGRWGILVGGFLFGLHPMRVESVAWATERKDVLFAAFYFAALLSYVAWLKAESSGRRIMLLSATLVLGLLSLYAKVQAVSLPFSMLMLDFWFKREKGFVTLVLEKAPYWALSFIFGMVNLFTLGSPTAVKLFKTLGVVGADYQASLVSINEDKGVTDFSFFDRLCIGAYSFCVYLYKLIIPYPMSPLYPYPKPLPVMVYVAPFLFIGIWFGIWWLWKRGNRIWVFGMLFFFLNVMFLLQVLGAGQGFLADRFTYVPYFGMFAVAAYYFDQYFQIEKLKMPLLALASVTGLSYCIYTVKQIAVWENGETLWTHVMKYEKMTNSLPYWNRGQYRRSQGRYEDALKDYTQAINIEPNKAELRNSRGKTHFDMGMNPKYKNQSRELILKAIEDYDAGLSFGNISNKNKGEILINRGAAHGALGNFQKTVEDITEGLKHDATNKNGYFNRSIANYTLGRYKEALVDYTKYLEYDPFNANVWYESGMIQRVLGDNNDALRRLNNAIKYDPRISYAYRERARVYALMGQKAQAAKDYDMAKQLGLEKEQMDLQLIGQ
jgi:protein O-mannosyl-transferase